MAVMEDRVQWKQEYLYQAKNYLLRYACIYGVSKFLLTVEYDISTITCKYASD